MIQFAYAPYFLHNTFFMKVQFSAHTLTSNFYHAWSIIGTRVLDLNEKQHCAIELEKNLVLLFLLIWIWKYTVK